MKFEIVKVWESRSFATCRRFKAGDHVSISVICGKEGSSKFFSKPIGVVKLWERKTSNQVLVPLKKFKFEGDYIIIKEISNGKR